MHKYIIFMKYASLGGSGDGDKNSSQNEGKNEEESILNVQCSDVKLQIY